MRAAVKSLTLHHFLPRPLLSPAIVSLWFLLEVKFSMWTRDPEGSTGPDPDGGMGRHAGHTCWGRLAATTPARAFRGFWGHSDSGRKCLDIGTRGPAVCRRRPQGQPHPSGSGGRVWPFPPELAAHWQRQKLNTQPYKQIHNYGKGTVRDVTRAEGRGGAGRKSSCPHPLLLTPSVAPVSLSENLKAPRGPSHLSSSLVCLFLFNAQCTCTCWTASQGPFSF